MIKVMCLCIMMILCLPSHAAEADGWYKAYKELYFGVPVQVRFKGDNPELAQRVWTFLENIDEHFNDYRDDSEIGKINKQGQGRYEISELMREAIQVSYQAHAVSHGAFDITVGPLRRLWKGAAKSGALPTAEAIQSATEHVGMQHIWLGPKQLHIHKPGISLDFGGIVKGLAVDHAMRMIQDAGITNAMVQVGGETAAIGISPRGEAHAFAIPNPKNPTEMLHIVQDPGTGYSGCTSGNYRLPIMISGKPYYHIFDPRSGKPGSVHILSVSVIFPQVGRNALADALSTSGVILEPSLFISIVESLGGACLVIEQGKDGELIEHSSNNWQQFIRKSR